MSAQVTSEQLNQLLSFSSLAAVIAGAPPEVALGALAGAVIFVTSAVEYPIRRRVLLSMLSFLCGLLFYKPAASILIGIASLIPTITQDSFEKGIVFSAGAFVSAIVAVRIGIWLYHRSDNPRELIPGEKTMVTHEFFLLITNAVICTGIAIRVVTFRRNGSQHRRWGGWLAYFLIVAAASIPVRVAYAIWLRTPMAVDLSEVIINAVMLAAVIKTRGNVVQIFKVSRSKHGD